MSPGRPPCQRKSRSRRTRTRHRLQRHEAAPIGTRGTSPRGVRRDRAGRRDICASMPARLTAPPAASSPPKASETPLKASSSSPASRRPDGVDGGCAEKGASCELRACVHVESSRRGGAGRLCRELISGSLGGGVGCHRCRRRRARGRRRGARRRRSPPRSRAWRWSGRGPGTVPRRRARCLSSLARRAISRKNARSST